MAAQSIKPEIVPAKGPAGIMRDDDSAFPGAGRPAYQTTQTPSRLSTVSKIMGSIVGCRADNNPPSRAMLAAGSW
jgi:hypothetical protein